MPPRQALLLEGVVRPHGYQHLDWYLEYLVTVEEYRYGGYPEATLTLYPHVVCNRNYGCPGAYAPPASALEVRARYVDGCYAGVYEAHDMSGYRDPIRSVVLFDNVGSSCGSNFQLELDITHADGTREVLEGYRTY